MKNRYAVLFALLASCATHVAIAQTTREQISSILARPAVAANTWTILIQNDVGTVTYYQTNATVGLIPASNTKLFTVSAAFGLLGTNHYFESRINLNGPLVNGTLAGDLNLVSEHDMTWNDSTFGAGNSRAAFDYLAAQLKSRGLTNITGNVQCYGVCYYHRPSADTAHNSQSQDVYNAEAAVGLVAALQAQGITVSGTALGQVGFAPPGTLFYTHKSSDLTYNGQPLTLDVACIPLAKVSHNVMADELLRHLAYKITGIDSFNAGAPLVLNWLTNTAGLSTNGMVMNDGSGLSHGNRFSAQQITSLIRYMLPAFPSWKTILPIGCVDGNLSSRFCGTDAAAQVHAKTGSLTPSIALSGYIDNKYSGRRFLFSFIGNNGAGIDQDSTRQAIDDCVTLFGAPVLNCVDPANLGKGDWIWHLPSSQSSVGATNLNGFINYEKNKGMQWITVKCGDGNSVWSQFDTNLVAQCHTAGLKIFAWAYAYGGVTNVNNPSDVPGEINVALSALSKGADGFIIDAESEYETLGVTGAPLAADQYCQGIRAGFPDTFLAHAPFVSFNSVRTNLYRTLGKYCDAVMPQAYYDFSGVSVAAIVPRLDLQWTTAQNLWIATGYADSVKPIAPIGWGASPSVGSEIGEFIGLLKSDSAPATIGGYKGVSFWDCESHTADLWDAIGKVTFGDIYPPIINAQPQNQSVSQGASVTFTVSATGPAPISYQWKLNGNDIAGAIDSSLALDNLQATNAGVYTVIVSNAWGWVSSSAARLNVSTMLFPLLFADNFDTNSSVNWNLYWGANNNVADYTVDWAFDYSSTHYTLNGVTNVIPPAPNSSNGISKAVRLTANHNDAVASIAGVSLYPKSKTFSSNYVVKFDLWINYPGGASGINSTGSTEMVTCGLNHFGTQANWGASTAASTDGLWFALDGEGGTTRDYRAYLGNLSGTQTELLGYAASGLMESNSTAAFYKNIFPSGQFETAGAPGKTWAAVELSQSNNIITLKINDNIIAQRANSSSFTSGDIMIGYMDPISSIANPAADAYALFDNLRVEDLGHPIFAPTILTQPQSQIVSVGTNITFTATVTGTPNLSYQWGFNGTNISGATTNSYTRLNVRPNDSGTYSLLVSNLAGSVSSPISFLTALPSKPVFGLPTLNSNHEIQFNLQGDANSSMTIEASINLVEWTTVTNLFSATGAFQFTNPLGTNQQRFYRASSN